MANTMVTDPTALIQADIICIGSLYINSMKEPCVLNTETKAAIQIPKATAPSTMVRSKRYRSYNSGPIRYPLLALYFAATSAGEPNDSKIDSTSSSVSL
ncbi:hypothetical protein SDC9_169379 [bioreactor metagenome]|uniref:Uncharacterized protein n=1 Tax=bioreactor metagenome TaxID=1076179 RepID=A0A645G772_9ZZZZ